MSLRIFSLFRVKNVPIIYKLFSGTNVNQQNVLGATALHYGISDSEISKFLILNNADLSLVTQSGWTVLHAAATKGSLETVKLLLKCKADPTKRTHKGKLPFELAKNGEIKDFLLEKNRKKARNNIRRSLDFASMSTPAGNSKRRLEGGKSIPISSSSGSLHKSTVPDNYQQEKLEFEVLKEQIVELRKMNTLLTSSLQNINLKLNAIHWMDENEITLLEVIGNGEFSTVHKALWRGSLVAVKIVSRTQYEEIAIIQS